MTEKRFTNEDMDYLCELLHKRFLDYYRGFSDEMSLSERLYFTNLQEFIETGFRMALNGDFEGID